MKTLERIYQYYSKRNIISTDSRKIDEGCVFVALKGERFDGNDFAYQVAIEGKAACVIADRKDLPAHERLFIVENSLTTLQHLARLHRERCNIPIIGITGTNGKTTTKELVATTLSKKYNIIYTQGNFNNHLGVPLTLLRIKPETELAVVEMGANHPGEIAQLCEIAQPDYGIITNIGKAHIEGFGSFDGVIKTKNELYQYLRTKGESLKTKVFVNGNNELLMKLSDGMDRIVYKTTDNRQRTTDHTSPFLEIDWNNNNIKTHLVGDYNYENVMAAIAVGTYFGVEENLIIEALENYVPSNNRSQFIRSEKNEIVMDAYNANPSSMHHSITNFKNIADGNTLLILGDMKELGCESENEHRHIINLLKELNFDNVILVGEEFKKVSHGTDYMNFNNVEELIEHINQNGIVGKRILIKGSNSTHLEKLANIL
ncbi:MAG: UDP-N-acetylmuramoyl-tripeptide--D-alanyl-D-alanine ligase [Bacteroidales bacterium]|nr:UDP-N-acetylmuramoyl-tripeptide--D-alanyl-D-alanine ligase [Bacteroidales bacterium]MBQ2906523.1 UDP-N-acetylmuramoyl-tripeptide--D-alanyl-D-alanine ligase [Bacteroidales bacterium]